MCLKLSTCFQRSGKQKWLSTRLQRGRADETDRSVTTELTQKWAENLKKKKKKFLNSNQLQYNLCPHQRLLAL